jgi:hypothetical protein
MVMNESYNTELQRLMQQMAEINSTMIQLASQNKSASINQTYSQPMQPSYAVSGTINQASADASKYLQQSIDHAQAAWQLSLNQLGSMQGVYTREQEESIRRQIGRNIGDAGFSVASGGARIGGEILLGALGAMAGGVIGGGVGAFAGGSAATMLSDKLIDPVINKVTNERQLKRYYMDFVSDYSYQWINPTESTSKWGMGYNYNEQKNLAKYLRQANTDKFVRDQDVQDMLQGFTDNRLLTDVSSVNDFEKKFSQMVDVVKTSARVLNKSYREVTDLMGEYERMGIGAENFSYVASKVKAAASYTGMDVNSASNVVLGMSSPLIRGSALSAGQIVGNVSEYLGIASQMGAYANSTNNQILGNIVANMGSPENLAQNLMSTMGGILQNQGINTYFAGTVTRDSSGRFVLDQNKVNQVLNGQINMQDLYGSAASSLNSMSAADRLQYQQESSRLFANLPAGQQMQLMNSFINAYASSTGFTANPAFVSAQFGVDINTAEMLVESLKYGSSAEGRAAAHNITAAANSEVARANKEIWDKEHNIFNQIGNFFSRTAEDVMNIRTGSPDRFSLVHPSKMGEGYAPMGSTLPLTSQGIEEYAKQIATHEGANYQAGDAVTRYKFGGSLLGNITSEDYLYAKQVLADPTADSLSRDKAKYIVERAEEDFQFTLNPVELGKRLWKSVGRANDLLSIGGREILNLEDVADWFKSSTAFGRVGSEKSIEEQRYVMNESLKTAQKSLSGVYRTLGGYAGLDEKAILSAIESGDVNALKKLVGNTIQGADLETLVGAAGSYSTYFENVAEMNTMVSRERMLAESSRVGIEAFSNFLMGDVLTITDERGNLVFGNRKRNQIEQLQKEVSRYEDKLKRGVGYLSDADMQSLSRTVSGFFTGLSDKETEALVKQYNISESEVMRGGKIDKALLQDVLMENFTRSGANTSGQITPDTLEKAMQDHTQAFSSMLDMVLKETDIMMNKMAEKGWSYSAGPSTRSR